MYRMKELIVSMAAVVFIGGFVFALIIPSTALADDGCNRGFLGFPAWYQGLTDGSCNIVNPDTVGGLSNFIWRIVLNVVEIFMMLAGYLSVGFVIYGGFLLMTARGKSAEVAEGQMMIRNAVIGLVISFGSVAVVNFIVNGVLN